MEYLLIVGIGVWERAILIKHTIIHLLFNRVVQLSLIPLLIVTRHSSTIGIRWLICYFNCKMRVWLSYGVHFTKVLADGSGGVCMVQSAIKHCIA